MSIIIKCEIERFRRKGILNLTLAYAQAIGFFYFSFKLGELYWPKILALHENRTVLYFGIMFYNISLVIILNFIYEIIYYLEIPFFE